MWRNYLIVGLRVLSRNKLFAFINLAGLTLGLAACIMILLFVRHEISFDGWLGDSGRAFQLQTVAVNAATPAHSQLAPRAAAAALAEQFPEIEAVAYALPGEPIVIKENQAFSGAAFYADPAFFSIVQVPFIRGDPQTALSTPDALVLTESEADRFFGSADVLGERLTLVVAGRRRDYRVTGVVRDLPDNTHLAFTKVLRFNESDFAEQPSMLTDWTWAYGYLYVRLRSPEDAEAINARLPAWERRAIPPQQVGGGTVHAGDAYDYRLVNVRDIHLGPAQEGAMTPGNDRGTVATFTIVALLILGVACVNFTNLSTARASLRAREVALRKVLGASRRQLVAQFLGESALMALLALILALSLVELLLPLFGQFIRAELSLAFMGPVGILLLFLAAVLLVAIMGGLYPALFLARFSPARVLKANRSSAEAGGSAALRNVLVVAQFAVSIGLIICTAVVLAQARFAQTSGLGYEHERLIQIENIGRPQMWPIIDTLRREIAAVPNIIAVGRTGIAIGTDFQNVMAVQVPGHAEPLTIERYDIDPGFFDAMGIRLVAGRNFSEDIAQDDATTPFPDDPAAERALVARGLNIVISELAATRMGFADAGAAIGKQVSLTVNDPQFGLAPATIIGVVADVRYRSAREAIEPVVYIYRRIGHGQMMVRFAGDPAATRAEIERVWRRVAPDIPFEAAFAEDRLFDLYASERARGIIFAAFAILTIVVACLGLFGLAAFTAERRTKEIGIRKVLGARTQDILRLLVWQFVRPILLANLIAWPIAWWVLRNWLNGFDTRIDLGFIYFVAAGLAAFAIATATISGHALRVAHTSPAFALRDE